MLSIFSACTIGGEESQGVVTIESTTETTTVDEEITFEEGVLDLQTISQNEISDSTLVIDNFKVKKIPVLAKILTLSLIHI